MAVKAVGLGQGRLRDDLLSNGIRLVWIVDYDAASEDLSPELAGSEPDDLSADGDSADETAVVRLPKVLPGSVWRDPNVPNNLHFRQLNDLLDHVGELADEHVGLGKVEELAPRALEQPPGDPHGEHDGLAEAWLDVDDPSDNLQAIDILQERCHGLLDYGPVVGALFEEVEDPPAEGIEFVLQDDLPHLHVPLGPPLHVLDTDRLIELPVVDLDVFFDVSIVFWGVLNGVLLAEHYRTSQDLRFAS